MRISRFHPVEEDGRVIANKRQTRRPTALLPRTSHRHRRRHALVKF